MLLNRIFLLKGIAITQLLFTLTALFHENCNNSENCHYLHFTTTKIVYYLEAVFNFMPLNIPGGRNLYVISLLCFHVKHSSM